MKRFIQVFLILAIILGIGAFVFYKYYLPDMIAEIITKDETSAYVPSFVVDRIEKYRKPINEAAEDAIIELRRQQIPVSQVVKSIDNLSDEQLDATVKELQATELTSTDQVFDIIVKNVDTEFPLEAVRKPFNKHVELSMIEKVLADEKQHERKLDPYILKAVAKKILLEKEAEVQLNP